MILDSSCRRSGSAQLGYRRTLGEYSTNNLEGGSKMSWSFTKFEWVAYYACHPNLLLDTVFSTKLLFSRLLHPYIDRLN